MGVDAYTILERMFRNRGNLPAEVRQLMESLQEKKIYVYILITIAPYEIQTGEISLFIKT